MRLIERRDYIVNCNWKVYVDNYLEGYHIPMAHPGLFKEVDTEQYRIDTFRYYSSAHAPIRDLKTGDLQGRDRRYVRALPNRKRFIIGFSKLDDQYLSGQFEHQYCSANQS